MDTTLAQQLLCEPQQPEAAKMFLYLIQRPTASWRDVMNHMNWSSTGTVSYYRDQLVAAGLIQPAGDKKQYRGIKLADTFPIPIELPVSFCPCCGPGRMGKTKGGYKCGRCGFLLSMKRQLPDFSDP